MAFLIKDNKTREKHYVKSARTQSSAEELICNHRYAFHYSLHSFINWFNCAMCNRINCKQNSKLCTNKMGCSHHSTKWISFRLLNQIKINDAQSWKLINFYWLYAQRFVSFCSAWHVNKIRWLKEIINDGFWWGENSFSVTSIAKIMLHSCARERFLGLRRDNNQRKQERETFHPYNRLRTRKTHI